MKECKAQEILVTSLYFFLFLFQIFYLVTYLAKESSPRKCRAGMLKFCPRERLAKTIYFNPRVRGKRQGSGTLFTEEDLGPISEKT